jgi:NAD(P)-dependent dehydrogenase (short-subunit alcohol dehydrogenase family)
MRQNGETYDKWLAYGQSKTGNVLFSLELAEKLGKKGLLAYSVHPGSIVTRLGRHLSKEDRDATGKLPSIAEMIQSY